ncbi:MAG: hypothetical protein ABI232_05775 [Jatrophihabitantaceae bacterium]
MLIDCDTCIARGDRCHDCVITVLLGMPTDQAVELDAAEQAALTRLADAGLVPRLQLVPDISRSVQGIA